MTMPAAVVRIRSALVDGEMLYWDCNNPPPIGLCCTDTPIRNQILADQINTVFRQMWAGR
jgi:hypothetical protein